jgi:predicted CXXCH cytochrome family protein
VHEPGPAEEQLLSRALLCAGGNARYVLGEKHSRRFLVPSEKEPGRHVLLPCRYDVGPAEWVPLHASDWKDLTWERGCGACHATGFSSAEQSFHELGVGCEACHGASSRHGGFSDRGGMAHFGAMSPREEVTVCASCHLQGGRSRTTGLNYAKDYDPGDDLFSDYAFSWESLDAVAEDAANPIDIHQKLLIRDQAGPGSEGRQGELRCTSCHEAHGFGHARHVELPRREYCYLCHARAGFSVKEYDQSCNVCEF